MATIFPIYDWVRQILGERASDVELTLLQDSGADLHSYQPSAEDMVKISNCDMFLYVGGESDEWVESALASAANKKMVAVNLMQALGDTVKEEELVEGSSTTMRTATSMTTKKNTNTTTRKPTMRTTKSTTRKLRMTTMPKMPTRRARPRGRRSPRRRDTITRKKPTGKSMRTTTMGKRPNTTSTCGCR